MLFSCQIEGCSAGLSKKYATLNKHDFSSGMHHVKNLLCAVVNYWNYIESHKLDVKDLADWLLDQGFINFKTPVKAKGKKRAAKL